MLAEYILSDDCYVCCIFTGKFHVKLFGSVPL